MPDPVNVVIDISGRLGTISSSRETKDDIAGMRDAIAALMQLRPVAFHYKTDAQSGRPAASTWPRSGGGRGGVPGPGDNREGRQARDRDVPVPCPMWLNKLQKQQRTVEAQREEIAQLRQAMAALIAQAALFNKIAAQWVVTHGAFIERVLNRAI